MTRRLRAADFEGGFMFHLVGTGDLGLALMEDVIVELEDGSSVGLFDAVLRLLRGRSVAGIVVLTDPAAWKPSRERDCDAPLCYLAFAADETSCINCGSPVPAGLVGHSDDFPPAPICWACLAKHDGRLMATALLIGSLRRVERSMDPDGDPEELAEEARELLRFIRACLAPARI